MEMVIAFVDAVRELEAYHAVDAEDTMIPNQGDVSHSMMPDLRVPTQSTTPGKCK